MDRRSFFRLGVDLPGELTLDSGIRLPVRVRNLSGGGVQIQCDVLDSGIIAPGGDCLDRSGRPIELDLSFAPQEGGEVQLRCRVVFVRRVSHHEYRLGLRFADPFQPDLFRLEQILHRALER